MSKMLQRKAGLFGTRCMNTRHSTFTFAFVTSILISVFLGSCVELVGYLCLIDLKKNTKKSREVYSGGWQVGGILSLETGDAEGVLLHGTGPLPRPWKTVPFRHSRLFQNQVSIHSCSFTTLSCPSHVTHTLSGEHAWAQGSANSLTEVTVGAEGGI